MILRGVASFVLLVAGAALMLIVQSASGLSFTPAASLDASAFVSIILTALGVILAALALFIGVLAIIGWTTFESKVKNSSEQFLEKRFSTDDPRYLDLIKEIKEDVRRQIDVSRKRTIIENESPYSEDAV